MSAEEAGFDEAIEAAHAAGVAAYSAVIVNQNTFSDFVRSRCDGPAADFFDRVDGAELYLIAGCLEGEPRALARFDSDYLRREVPVGASRLRCDAGELDDILQEVRRMLLVGGRDAKLGRSSARGDLRALIRLMALRAGISLRRKHGREALTGDDVLELVDDNDAPALALAKQEHRAALSSALARAIEGLEPTRRAVLKMHCLDGVPLAQLAVMHRVDRSTISRWIARAREDILAATRTHLAGSGVPVSQFDSFIDLVRSNFELSLRRMLER